MSFEKWANDLADVIRENNKKEEPEYDDLFMCDNCCDQGWVIGMVCYGGPPVERKVYCPDCQGTLGGSEYDG